jgi:predicted esterase
VRRLSAIALAATVLASCGGASRSLSLPEPLSRLYAYDSATPLELRDLGVLNSGYPVKVHDVTFLSPQGGRVPAFLVVPPGKGQFAGVVFMHGSTGSRFDFLPTAVRIARRGAVALTITSPFDRPGAHQPSNTLAGLRELRGLFVQEVVDLRRGIDVLERRPDVDPKRIGFAGFSLGAEVGAILAAVDPRLSAVDLISGGGELAFAPPLRPRLRRTAVPLLSTFQPSRFVRYVRAPLFQVGTRDAEISRTRLLGLIRPAPAGKTVRWYPTGHALNPRATRDFEAWISERLGL